MAFTTTNSTNNILMADNAALSLPDADWTLAIWVKQTTGVQAYQQRIFANGDAGITNEYYFMINATGSWEFDGYDGDGTSIFPASTGTPFSGNTSWTHLAVVRSGSDFTLYRNGASDGSVTDANFDGVNSANSLTFCNRGGGTQNRALVGSIAEFAKWDRALGTTELEALADGFAPTHFPNSLMVYMPCIREYKEYKVGITITNNSSTVSDHPRIIYPAHSVFITPVSSTAWSGVVNESSVFGGSGVLNSNTLATINEVSVFGGSGTLNSNTLATINALSIFGGTGVIEGAWLPTVSELSVFGGVSILNSDTLGVVSEVSLFGGSSVLNSDTLAAINEVSLFGGTASLVLNFTASINEVSVFGGAAIVNANIAPTINEVSIFTGSAVLSSLWELVTPNSASDFVLVSTNTNTDFVLVSVNTNNDFVLVS